MSKWDLTISGFICCDEYSDLSGVRGMWDRRQRGGKIATRSSVNAGKAHHPKVDVSCQGDSLRLFVLDQSCMVFVGIVALLLLRGPSGN